MRVSRSLRCARFAGVLLLGLLWIALPSAADTIIVTGVGADGPSVNGGQFEAQGWAQTQTYDDVSISVELFSWMPGATFDITAYLTDAIGPSATSSALASTSFSGETARFQPADLYAVQRPYPRAWRLLLNIIQHG